ncbi:lysostaphin resistance A-like protein [Persicitalea sp.]|uniref:CPBP family intramembrane glutamic endopeptidase n=1 Tax=Persicitalea sp. TaxID=3100273 RepID=UPI00359319A1
MTRTFLIKLGYLLLEVLTFAIIVFPIVIAFAGIFEVFGMRMPADSGVNNPQNPYQATLVDYIPQIIAFLTAFFVMRKWIFKRSFTEMGLTWKNLLPDLTKGFGLSVILVVAGFGVLFVLQKLDYTGTLFNFEQFSGLLVLFLFQSWSEEIMSRGFLLATIAHYFGDVAGLLVSAFLFSLLHFFNPDFAWIGGTNIFLAGIALGLLYLKYRNLWVCTGFHWGWNFVQAGFFDFNVSGFDVFSFIRFKPLAPAWLSGGTFGFEGSILAVLFLLAFSVYYWRQVDFSTKKLPES